MVAKTTPEGELELPATTLCKVLGIPRWKYQDWEQAGFLSRAGTRCLEADAIEAAVVHLIAGEVSDDEDVLGIIESVRGELRDRLCGPEAPGRVRLVCHLRGARGVLIYGNADGDVGRALSDAGPSLVIDVAAKIDQVRRDFRHRASLRRPAKKPTVTNDG